MDIQLTDFENAALTVFMSMIVNVLNSFDVNFTLPITLVDENMKRVSKRNALLDLKFWFRTNVLPNNKDHKVSDL